MCRVISYLNLQLTLSHGGVVIVKLMEKATWSAEIRCSCGNDRHVSAIFFSNKPSRLKASCRGSCTAIRCVHVVSSSTISRSPLPLISCSSPKDSNLVRRGFVGAGAAGAAAPFAEDSVSIGPSVVGFASIVLPCFHPSRPESPGLLASVALGLRRTSQAPDSVPEVQNNPASAGPSSCRGCQSWGSPSKRGNFLWEGRSDPLELCPVLPFRPCNSSRSPGITSRTNVGLYSS